MEPQQSSTLYRSISKAAVALALGGRFVRQIPQQLSGQRVLFFEITPPDGLDFDAPDLVVPVAPLLAWTEALATRVREFRGSR
jgi:hypothetical protein